MHAAIALQDCCSIYFILLPFCCPRGLTLASSTPFGCLGLGIGFEEKVLAMALDRGQGQDL